MRHDDAVDTSQPAGRHRRGARARPRRGGLPAGARPARPGGVHRAPAAPGAHPVPAAVRPTPRSTRCAPRRSCAPAHRAVLDGIRIAAPTARRASTAAWVAAVGEAAPLAVRGLVSELSVAPLPTRYDSSTGLPPQRYLDSLVVGRARRPARPAHRRRDGVGAPRAERPRVRPRRPPGAHHGPAPPRARAGRPAREASRREAAVDRPAPPRRPRRRGRGHRARGAREAARLGGRGRQRRHRRRGPAPPVCRRARPRRPARHAVAAVAPRGCRAVERRGRLAARHLGRRRAARAVRAHRARGCCPRRCASGCRPPSCSPRRSTSAAGAPPGSSSARTSRPVALVSQALLGPGVRSTDPGVSEQVREGLARVREQVGLELTPEGPFSWRDVPLCYRCRALLRRSRGGLSPVAQLAEQPAVNRQVVGSSPTGGATPVRGPDTAMVTGPLSCRAAASWVTSVVRTQVFTHVRVVRLAGRGSGRCRRPARCSP